MPQGYGLIGDRGALFAVGVSAGASLRLGQAASGRVTVGDMKSPGAREGHRHSTRRSITVLRHGETDWNAARLIQGRTEVPLNERGRIQASESAALLSETGSWRRIVASPLGRARETAEIIAEALGLDAPALVPDIIERDFGPAEGMLVPEAEARWPGLEVPGAEALDELGRRGAAALTRLLHDEPGTIVVAHGALMRAALGELAGIDMPRVRNGELWLVEEAAGSTSVTGPAQQVLPG